MKALKLPTKLVIHVVGNVFGLADIFLNAGMISTPGTFHEFVHGFNSFDELVTFVNVGAIANGVNLTYSKIQGMHSGRRRITQELPRCMPTCHNVKILFLD